MIDMSVEVLETKYNNLMDEVKELKTDFKDFQKKSEESNEKLYKKLEENSKDFNAKFDKVIELIKSEYVSKEEFKPYKDKLNWLQKWLIWIVWLILAWVIWAILKTILIQ